MVDTEDIVVEAEDTLDDEELLAAYEALVEAARRNFTCFLHLLWPQHEAPSYIIGDLHAYLADLVQKVVDGERAPRQAVSVPPQHGKSRLLAVRTVAWLLGYKPGISIAITGFSHSLLEDFLKEVEEIVNSSTYRKVFSGMITKFGQNKAGSKTYRNGSNVRIKSAGSKLTGRRVDWLIIDDAHAGRAEAESPILRAKVVRWYFGDCLTRLSKNAKVFIIGTRWHPDDLIGTLTEEEYVRTLIETGKTRELYEVTNIRALCEDDDDPLGRPLGVAAFPEERPVEMMESLKSALPGYEWDSQYRGAPRSAMGGQVDTGRLRYCASSDVPWDRLTPTRGWDLAISEKQTADFTAGAMVAVHRDTGDLWLIDMFRRRMAWAKLKANVLSVSRDDRAAHGVYGIAVEGVSGFDAIYSDVRDSLLGEVHVTKRNPPKGGKLVRAQRWLNKVEAGQVVIVRGPWNKEFISELEQFPSGAHDDQIDAVSIGYEELVDAEPLLIA